MLAVPLGNVRFVSGFVQKKLLGRLQDTVNRLVEFEDTQAATYLLRVSFSIVRAVHFMRTTPLEQWKEEASRFDSMIRNAIEPILGFPMDDPTFAQACLTPRSGGLGLRKVVEHADLAYRNLVDSIGTDALLSPDGKERHSCNTTGRRPGDVTFQRWAEGKALVI